MVSDIFPVSSVEILKPINNAAMSLISIQKNINSPPHQHGPAFEATYKWGTHLQGLHIACLHARSTSRD